MTLIDRVERVLVVAPHPDDEVLGCGGTIARLASAGCTVEIVIVTRGREPRFDAAGAEAVRNEALAAHRQLGIARTRFLDLPAAELDQLPQADVNAAIANIVADFGPDTLFIPFVGDLHFDHRIVFEASMVAARPRGLSFPARILAYETLSETNWSAPYLDAAFQPNLFVDITDHLEAKIAAFTCFRSQVCSFPDERSVEAVRALALVRGVCVSRAAAEAFISIREVA